MSERVGSDIERLRISTTSYSTYFMLIEIRVINPESPDVESDSFRQQFQNKKGSAPPLMEIFIYVRAKHRILLGVIEVNQL